MEVKLEGENGVPSNLVGGIVEKGFDNKKQKLQTPPPLPTVLPFPVARHRSHGPHWNPVSSESLPTDIDQDSQDKDDTDFKPIADFADPIKRKPKKTLNLSRWREVLSQDSSSSSLVNKGSDFTIGNRVEGDSTNTAEKLNIGVQQVLQKPRIDNSMGNSIKTQSEKATDDVESMHSEFKEVRAPDSSSIGYQDDHKDYTCNDDMVHDLNVKHEARKPHDFVITNYEDEQGTTSLESQIDLENRAKLQNMSADEIAEAQREMLGKMKPGLIEALKKRGQNKLRSKVETTACNSESGRRSSSFSENQINQQLTAKPPVEESKSGHVSEQKSNSHIHDGQNSGGVKTSDEVKNKWSVWRERVETVRTLRFSMDGTVLENHPSPTPNLGNNSNAGQNTADRVTERDYLRTEGDPGSVGYTIKEAVELSRSTIPGQRSLALQLLASVLSRTLCEIQQEQVGSDLSNVGTSEKFIDWKAVWAYALGPEPELALSLRLVLDDNHISVVFTTVKVLHCILSCEINEDFFDFSERMATCEKVMCTAPVFRSKPRIEVGFLHGGFWKYNTKPSNILPLGDETGSSQNEENHTIQDDVIVAGQDFAAGLIRMGVIPRIQFLLVTDPSAALEEHLLSILIALARHSPTSANTIIKFPELIPTIVDRFIRKDTLEINHSKIKSVTLVKVLAQFDKKICINFIEKGIIRDMMWHFYRSPVSFEQWIKSGKEYCKLMSSLMVEQLRLWKVCVQYGYCISYFTDFFPILCLWLTPPTFKTLIENNILVECTSVSREAYLVLNALSSRLPDLHSVEQLNGNASNIDHNTEMWSWSQVNPMVESALKWLSVKSNPYLSEIIDVHERTAFVEQDPSISSIIWVVSAVVHMLSSILKKVAPRNHNNFVGGGDSVPWLPEFVPKIGLEIIRNNFLDFSGRDGIPLSGGGSLTKGLCQLRLHSGYELSLSSVCCLHGIFQLIVSLDKSVQSAKQESYTPSSEEHSLSRESKILEDGIYMWSEGEVKSVLATFLTLASSGWHEMQCVESFGRGGPSPGVGLGWGASGGGFWSMKLLVKQTESLFLTELLDMFQIVRGGDEPTVEDVKFTLQKVNSVLGVCLFVGPRDTIVVEKALNFLLQVPVLKHLSFCIRHVLPNRGIKVFEWEYKDGDYTHVSESLNSHFRDRWLSSKKRKTQSVDSHTDSNLKTSGKKGSALGTIYEDSDISEVTLCKPPCTSLVIEWAHQRFPLPMHWLFSPISTINDSSTSLDEVLELAKSGLFFLLGLEAMSIFPCTSVETSPVHAVPLIWKVHSLSVVLLVGMTVLQEEKSRDLYGALQHLYGQLLSELNCKRKRKILPGKNESASPEMLSEVSVEFLNFQSDIHESYTIFIDTFIEQFAAASYGDVIYGRQVSLYLHRAVEAPVRLATWNALSNSHILELLPPLGECFADAEGYLDIEENEEILEAYAKSWVSGGLDKAALRGSMTFTLALHHLSSFIFNNHADDKLPLRNKLAKSLVRDYSRKKKHEGMILNLIQYNKAGASEDVAVERKFKLLAEACEGNSSLLTELENLKLSPKLLGK